MILPMGYETMTDGELRAALLLEGYDEAGADDVIAMVRSGKSEALD